MKTKEQVQKKCNLLIIDKIKNKLLLMILILLTTFSYSQHTLKYNSKTQLKIFNAINSNKDINKKLKKFSKKGRNYFVTNMSLYMSFSNEDRMYANEALLGCLESKKQISFSDKKILIRLLNSKTLKRKYLINLIQIKDSTKQLGNYLISLIAKKYLNSASPDADSVPIQGEGSKGKAVGAVIGGIIGAGAGAVEGGIGAFPGAVAGAGVGAVIGDGVGDAVSDAWGWLKDTFGKKDKKDKKCTTPKKKGCVNDPRRNPNAFPKPGEL